jgi:diguanylate cyclase (GGDEF)-like protein
MTTHLGRAVHSPDMSLIARAAPATASGRDARRLALSFRAVAAVTLLFGVIEIGVAAAIAAPRLMMLAALAISVSIWLAREAGRMTGARIQTPVLRLNVVVLLVLPVTALIEPAIAAAVAITAIMPVVLAIPFVSRPALGRMMIIAALSGLACISVSGVATASASGLQPGTILGIGALFAAYVLVFAFLWTVSGRLKDVASDLTNVVAMSRDLARTLDPILVGDSIARHIAEATGADECGVNYLDADGDSLRVHGHFPAERRAEIDPIYSASAYPATLRAMADQTPYVASMADPLADAQEVAFLGSIGKRSIAIVPLVAAGQAVGVVELTSTRPDAFSERELDIASMLAREAAMALENARLYETVHHQAFHDGLTGLPGRALFRDRVARALAHAGATDAAHTAVLYIDLNEFKLLNDRLGHAHGDALLTAVAERLQAGIRAEDTVARLGGDEFAVLLTSLERADEADDIAERLLEAICAPYRIRDRSASIGASIGVDVSEDGSTTVDDMLRNADVAMYAAKAGIGSRVARFDPSLRRAAAIRSQIARDLEGVDERGELRIDYQPIIDLDSGRITGLEALLRWQPPDRPLLMPAAFVDIAEETGAILSIGRWVLREACRNLRDWQTRLDLPDLHVSVNLTASQFDDPGVVGWVSEALSDTGVEPRCLTLEITESGLMDNTPQTIERLTELRKLGISVAIDDFGTGYSSLSYLERFPVDILKIDRSFISGPDGESRRSVLAPAIVDLARRLGLAVVAEGIETEEQAAWVRSIGCSLGQGYLFARPLGPVALEAALSAMGTSTPGAAYGGLSTRSLARRQRRTGHRQPDLRLLAGA